MIVPAGAVPLTCTTIVNVAVAAEANAAFVAVIVPVPPTAGVVSDQPADAVADTNVVFAGMTSVSETFCAF